jgi:hypothetical protein
LSLTGKDRIALLHLWPHARPWRVTQPEPMLRGVPQAQAVAKLLSDAWSHATGLAATPEAQPVAAAAAQGGHAQQPALAGR